MEADNVVDHIGHSAVRIAFHTVLQMFPRTTAPSRSRRFVWPALKARRILEVMLANQLYDPSRLGNTNTKTQHVWSPPTMQKSKRLALTEFT
jgi:hypothetical protein